MSSDGGASPPFLPTAGRGRLEETHSTSETHSQGQREVTLASRSLANAELGVIAGVIQGGSVGGYNRCAWCSPRRISR